MNEAQRAEHIDRLIEGIAIIGPGAMFERFGAKFLDHHLDVDLVHRGLNAQLNPVGGTVDSVDDGGLYAAEYSIEKGYFQGRWTKPTKDLLHVVNAHPDVREIYLLSSQPASPAEIKAAVVRVGAWPGFAGRTIRFYDARRIAEVIVEKMLLDDAAIGRLIEHLPVLGRILNEQRASLTIPAVDPQRVVLTAIEDAIAARLSDAEPVVALSGIGGSGKSDAAAAYVNAVRERYQTPMWVEGGDISKIEDLSETRLWRGGSSMNVAGMLKSRRCLLVIDDLPPVIELADLRALCAPGSHILVTRRETAKGDITIPGLSAEEARQILDRDLVETCPEAALVALMKAVAGHPLSLALVNKAVRAGMAWTEIVEECANIGELVDGRQTLADRILGRLRTILTSELTVFDWGGQPACDQRFLRFVIRAIGMAKIGGQGLLAADRPTIARLHDIVYASLKVQNWLTVERVEQLNVRLEEHLAVLVEEESLSLRVFATTMRPKLEAIVAAGSRSPAVLIALLEIWESDEVDVAVVGDPVAYVSALEARGGSANYAEVRFILEAIEALYRRDKLQSMEVARANYATRLPLFERLLALGGLTPRSYAEVRHHWGKALKILGKPDEALIQFEAVMNGPVPLNSTRLQLVRLYKSDRRAGVLADEILTAAGIPGRVTASVVLGVVEDLSWAKGTWLDELFDKHGDLIEREILGAADAGLEQAYNALASIGRHWSWREPARMLKVAAQLPMPGVATARDRTSGALGEIFAKTAKAAAIPDRAMQERALQFFDSIQEPNEFQRQKHAEALIDVGRFADAEAVLRSIEKADTKAFAAYRLSQARLGQGDPSEALTLIDAALAALTAQQSKYQASFLAHRWKVRQAGGDPEAIDDLDKAIIACEPGKYRVSLERQRQAES